MYVVLDPLEGCQLIPETKVAVVAKGIQGQVAEGTQPTNSDELVHIEGNMKIKMWKPITEFWQTTAQLVVWE